MEWPRPRSCPRFVLVSEHAAIGGFGLLVAYVADEWQWLVRRDGCDVAEGAARAALAAVNRRKLWP
ncbi:MAG: hypothetical protein JOZ29_16485 [Deltaproteobacteria bacterium]|nr:hypothetical protein [Deltaproteobacteria bacterium]